MHLQQANIEKWAWFIKRTVDLDDPTQFQRWAELLTGSN